MDATIEEFGKLYPAYATLYFKDECEKQKLPQKFGSFIEKPYICTE